MDETLEATPVQSAVRVTEYDNDFPKQFKAHGAPRFRKASARAVPVSVLHIKSAI
jgi:hypothetical protein